MEQNIQRKIVVKEEKKAATFFIWMFYIIFFVYEVFYLYFLPRLEDEKVGIPEIGLGIWYYLLILLILPIGIYFLKKGKPELVKYIFFIGYNFIDIINLVMKYSGNDIPFRDGKLIDVLFFLFASIFLNTRYLWVILIGIILKYGLMGIVLQDMIVLAPIGIYIFITVFSLVFLTRVLSYIKSLTNAYEEVQKQEKLIFLGQMATSLGHEIRNPLAALKGFTQLQQESDKSENNFYPIMLQEIDRIDTIVDDLMILGKPKSLNIKSCDVTEILEYVVSVSRQVVEMSGGKIMANFPNDFPKIDCDENQLKQVFINIIKNAFESMQGGGNIEVSCDLIGKNKIRVTVKDHGCGIDPETLKKLGEPFYTTKPDGSGLGLMVTKKIVEDHQGEVKFESEVGVGTTVSIILPEKQKIA